MFRINCLFKRRLNIVQIVCHRSSVEFLVKIHLKNIRYDWKVSTISNVAKLTTDTTTGEVVIVYSWFYMIKMFKKI